MTLSEEEKEKIKEEEEYRNSIRNELKKGEIESNHKENNNGIRTRWWHVLIAIIIFVSIIKLISLMSNQSGTVNSPNPQTTSNTITTATPTPVDIEALRKKHINISRKFMMDTFKKEGFVFKKFNTGNKLNMDSYIGTKDKAAIELTGNEDNLYAISFNADMGFDPDGTVGKSVVAQSQMLFFASLINKESVEWLTNEIHKAAANPEQLYNNQAEVSGRKYSYDCVPAIMCLFSIEPI